MYDYSIGWQIEVCSYDDLTVTSQDGVVRLVCPACGPVPVGLPPQTLSDLTNAAIEHLEQHPEARRHARLSA